MSSSPHRFWLALCLAMLLSSCATAKKVPDWVNSEPFDPLYYSSVVKVSTKQAGYQQLAMDTAFKNISMQISVQVDAQLSSVDTELSGVPLSEITTNIQTSSRNLLQDVELVGVYQTKTEYWAYFRLNKQNYQQQRQQLKNRAVELALQQLADFDSSTTDLVTGIPQLLHALEGVVDYLDLDLQVTYQNKPVNLYNEIVRKVKQLPLQVKPAFELAETPQVVAMQQLDLRLPVTVYYHKTESQVLTCRDFPLRFSFARGQGKLPATGFTAANGSYTLILERISSFEPNQSISAQINKDHFSAQIVHPLVKKIWDNLSFSPALISLQVVKPKIYLEYSFDGKQESNHKRLILDRLIELDLETTTDAARADFILSVDITSQPGSYISVLDVYSAFGNAHVSLIHAHTKQIVASESLLKIKSNASSMQVAELNTEVRTVRAICDELLYRMVSSYIMN